MSLIKKLKDLEHKKAISMHVPGHKNNTIGNLSDVISPDYDLTEIPGLDDLHDPFEVLNDLNIYLGKKKGSYYAQAMVNGTTNGIICSIYAFSETVSHFYIVGQAHKSVYHAVSLVNCTSTLISADELSEVSLENSCVIFTSPSYSGTLIKNIEEKIEFIRQHNGFTIVDAAHGAHLSITKNFPDSLLLSNADVVIESYHKMLPALTMASVLFTRNEDFHHRIMHYINQFETSSPSYLVLASIEYAQEFYNTYDDRLFFGNRRILMNHLKVCGISVQKQDDPAKFILNGSNGPYALERSFREAEIYSEMVTDEGVLWCLPLWHVGDRYLFDELLERLSNLKESSIEDKGNIDVGILEGKVCIENIVPYPPGVPLVLKGDVISTSHLKRIQHYQVNHVKIEGIDYNINYYMKRAEL